MEDFIRLCQAIAWPLVTLVGLILLGPGGYLMKFAKALGESLSNFTVAIPELRDTALRMRSDVDTLLATAKNVSTGFSEEYKGLEERIDQLSKRLSDQLAEVRDYMNELDKSKLGEVQESIEQALDGEQSEAEKSLRLEAGLELNSDEMMESIKAEWDLLTELLRGRLNNPEYFDKRQIGAMAGRLSHGKRLKPIAKADADFIAELHSQFKRFTRLSGSKDEWLTPEVYKGFLAGVKKASEALQ
ncbi:MAG TPA: hypothetical protein VE079_08580 [Ensifer sp.]|nr:hypothetical protein [Ensifer sp.]